MGLNIKNSRAEAAIRRLSEKTGESLTAAIQGAVEEKLARLDQASSEKLSDRIMEIARRSGPLWKKGGMEIEDLYDDETGLPK